MSGSEIDVAGFTAEVRKTAGDGQHHGIGFTAVACPTHGTPLLAVTVVHQDGTALMVFLDEERVNRGANAMADFVDALPAIRSKARH